MRDRMSKLIKPSPQESLWWLKTFAAGLVDILQCLQRLIVLLHSCSSVSFIVILIDLDTEHKLLNATISIDKNLLCVI